MFVRSCARPHLLAGAALFILAGAAPAFAQTAATPAATPAAAAPATVTGEDPTTDGGQIQDIVVTATKRETNLQKTPIASRTRPQPISPRKLTRKR